MFEKKWFNNLLLYFTSIIVLLPGSVQGRGFRLDCVGCNEKLKIKYVKFSKGVFVVKCNKLKTT